MKKCLAKIHWWEGLLCLSLVTALALDCRTYVRQQTLAQKVVRLHVLANSDSESDQTLKQQVKDCVYGRTEELLRRSRTRGEAVQRLEQALPTLQAAAQETVRQAGYDYPVELRLEETSFPNRSYGGFSLPAGEYLALRVLIGEAEGRNWWCVVFPPLCAAAVTEWEQVALEGGFSEEEVALLAEDDTVELKLWIVEKWKALRQEAD